MKMGTFVYRINLFAIIWGTIINLTLALSGCFGSPMIASAYRSVGDGFVALLGGEIGLSLLGILIAVPFSYALYIAGVIAIDEERLTPWFSLIVTAVPHLCILVWYVFFGPGTQYGPEGIFSGGVRLGLIGFVAAIVASYFVIRYFSSEVYQYDGLLASAALVIEILLSLAVSFPVYQNVRSSQPETAAIYSFGADMVGKAT